MASWCDQTVIVGIAVEPNVLSVDETGPPRYSYQGPCRQKQDRKKKDRRFLSHSYQALELDGTTNQVLKGIKAKGRKVTEGVSAATLPHAAR